MTHESVELHIERESGPRTYRVPRTPGMTVLDALIAIRERQDPTLVWRHSCRMGICGSCAMTIDGRPGLACNTQIATLPDGPVRLAPLAHLPVLRDLVVDTAAASRARDALGTRLERRDPRETEPGGAGTYRQSDRELTGFLQFAYCIQCAACVAACPTAALDETFPGPMALAGVQRWNADPRDEGAGTRSAALGDALAGCHLAGECSRVCPKGVDPALAIQRLRRSEVLGALGLRRGRGSRLHSEGSPGALPDDAPKAPTRTVLPGER
jgi:succinate dehydrogenase / fumarate reductase iron-sulfur subunit